MTRLSCESDYRLTSNIDVLLLAGGKGSRLKESGVCDLPKPLVMIRRGGFEMPMIENAIRGIFVNLRSNLVVLTSMDPDSRSDLVEDFVRRAHPCDSFSFSVEEEPLGTAGAACNALVQRNSRIGVIIPCDTLFPFNRLNRIVQTHIRRGSNVTWVLTSNPGEGAQNVDKILVDKTTGQIRCDFESDGMQPDICFGNLKPMTSVGVVVVDRNYFVRQFSQYFSCGAVDRVDLYRHFIPKLLESNQRVDSYNIQQPAQDLGTIDRLIRFGRG